MKLRILIVLLSIVSCFFLTCCENNKHKIIFSIANLSELMPKINIKVHFDDSLIVTDNFVYSNTSEGYRTTFEQFVSKDDKKHHLKIVCDCDDQVIDTTFQIENDVIIFITFAYEIIKKTPAYIEEERKIFELTNPKDVFKPDTFEIMRPKKITLFIHKYPY